MTTKILARAQMNKEELKGKFHSHITVPAVFVETASALLEDANIRHKVTVIELEHGDRSQQDAMITQYFHTRQYETFNNILEELQYTTTLLRGFNIDVLRVKLEHESLPTLKPSQDHYRECHIKLLIPTHSFENVMKELKEDDELRDFRLSNNPNEVKQDTTAQFINARSYGGSIFVFDQEIEKVTSYLRSKYQGRLRISECKIETAVYDSNLQLDNWWA